MADATPSQPVATGETNSRSRGNRPNRGRGRGRGGDSATGLGSGGRGQGDRGARRGGRGGGQRTEGRVQLGIDGNALQPSNGNGAGKATGGVTGDNNGEGGGGEVEAEVCFICASPVMHNSVAPCNHRNCHICALRMRALYKTKDCAHCRTPAPFVIFTDDATKRYEDFSDSDITFTDNNNGIRYENNEIMEDTILLLRYNCPDGDCDVACLGWPDLHRHVRAVHHKKICDLCSRHKKVFTHEHELFTDQELQKHMRKGDDNPGAVDQSGFKGHPECGFCRQRFYGDDELYVHCREKHERCFICDRRGGKPQYYVNYDSLALHYRKDHFMCSDPSCLEKKFIVFDTEIDLKAHQLEEHGDTLSKDVRRDARVVDISSFDYRAPYVQERRGGSQREQRDGRGRGRGRDPNAEPLPASSAQPLPRDQQAFQRQMAVHSAQSVSTRTFGGQLTSTPTPPPARAPANTPAPQAMTVPRPSPSVEAAISSLESLDLSSLPPTDQALQLRHRAVIERASILLKNDSALLTRFRNLVSSFKSGSSTPDATIDSFFEIFQDVETGKVSTLIREVADLYEDKGKGDKLRAALNDWRAINEDYPSLPGPSVSSGTLPLNWASANSTSGQPSKTKSNRVLKLKSSTAQSSRSPVSQTRSWGSASPATSSSSQNRFAYPELPSVLGVQNKSSTKVSTTPWAAPSSSSAPNSNPPSAPTSRPASTAPGGRGRNVGIGADAFPSLPKAEKPQMSLFGKNGGRAVIRGTGNAGGGSVWGAKAEDTSETNEGGEEESVGGKKGKKAKKQVLNLWA